MLLIPAAQYLRMSTEHQQFSLANQAQIIERYALEHGFAIVQTYSDSARSGVVLKRRLALRQLIQEVVGGTASFRAILVYDVSRWGRFQDADEAAHYEFLCKSAGIPVHYCAEPFPNDASIATLFIKTMKRVMAGEYSRELGRKVLEGHRRLARLGFKQGGSPGYGLRRVLLSDSGRPKQVLRFGERKSIATDRVVLEPGPQEEVDCVRELYRLFVDERRSVTAIAKEMNRRGVKYLDTRWDFAAVHEILSNPKYMGCHAYEKTTQRLYTRSVKRPRSQWVLTPGAFPAIVSEARFLQAQGILAAWTTRKSNDQLLEELRAKFRKEGRLSAKLVDQTAGMASASTYLYRFGSWRRACELAGYDLPNDVGRADYRQPGRVIRDDLLRQIQELFPAHVSVIRTNLKWRPRIQLQDGSQVAVCISLPRHVWKKTWTWSVESAEHEAGLITLLVRLTTDRRSVLDMYLLKELRSNRRFALRRNDPWLRRVGVRVKRLESLLNAHNELKGNR